MLIMLHAKTQEHEQIRGVVSDPIGDVYSNSCSVQAPPKSGGGFGSRESCANAIRFRRSRYFSKMRFLVSVFT